MNDSRNGSEALWSVAIAPSGRYYSGHVDISPFFYDRLTENGDVSEDVSDGLPSVVAVALKTEPT